MSGNRHRDDIIKSAQAMRQLGVIFDTETTGLGAYAEIVEIAVVDPDGNTLFESLVKPTKSIPGEVVAIHGINDEMVMNAPSIVDVLPQLLGYFQGKWALAYNFDYDRRLLKQSLERRGVLWPTALATWFDSSPVNPSPFRRKNCIMKLYAEFYGEHSDYHGDCKWQKLERAVQQCGLLVPHQLHRASADAKAAAAVLAHMATTTT